MSAADTGGGERALPIIPWHGGECPLPTDAPVQVQFRVDPSIDRNPPDGVTAGRLRWSHLRSNSYDGGGDIIAYRDLRPLRAAAAQAQAGGEG